MTDPELPCIVAVQTMSINWVTINPKYLTKKFADLNFKEWGTVTTMYRGTLMNSFL